MGATSPSASEPDDGSVTVTARHMADAVGYLTRVANNAGLRGIAGKLTNVRISLLKVVEDGVDEDSAADGSGGSATKSAKRSSGANRADDDGDDGGRNSR